MSIIDKLATSLDRRDEVPNQELAKEIIAKKDKAAVAELIELLQNHKNKGIEADCIKTLYEIGYTEPKLIAEYFDVFVNLLSNKNNRLVWGAMTALDTITAIKPKEMYEALPLITETMDKGTVITKDHGIHIMAKLATVKGWEDDAFSLMLEQIETSPENQFPSYVEKAAEVATKGNYKRLVQIAEDRLPELPTPAKIKRVEKTLKKLHKQFN